MIKDIEIIVPKISPVHDEAIHYDGVIAYGKGADGLAYVLKAQQQRWFVIYQAQQTETREVFKADDEQGEGLIFDYYDDAVQGFTYFLDEFCLIYYCQ